MNQSIGVVLPIITKSQNQKRRFLVPVFHIWIATTVLLISIITTNSFLMQQQLLFLPPAMIVRQSATISKRHVSSMTTVFPFSMQSWTIRTAKISSTSKRNCCGISIGISSSCRTSGTGRHALSPHCVTLPTSAGRILISRWSDFGMIHPRKRDLKLFSSSIQNGEETSSAISIGNSTKKRVVFLGSPPVAAESLQAIYEASQQSDSIFDVVAVISQPPKRGKRGGSVEPTAVGKMAQQLNISTIMTPEKANDPSFLQEFIDICPDLCITAAYGQYLPKRFLQTPKYGTINIHPSLLPKWRGASPVQRSLEAGDNPLGVSVLYTVSKMDAGPIITQATADVQDHETVTTVLPKLFQIGTQSLLSILPKVLDGTITMNTATVQNEEEATYAKLIDTAEAEFKVWNESATTCHNRLRGFHMWPKAYMYIQITNNNNKDDPPFRIKLKVHETRVVSGVLLPPTDILQTTLPSTATATTSSSASGLYVVCYDGSVLELITIQPPSKKAFPSRDLVHGYPNATIQWIRPAPEEDDDNNTSNSRESSSATKEKEISVATQ